MNQYLESTREDWRKTFSYIAVLVAINVIGTLFLLPALWYIWLILIAGSLFLLVRWHAKNFAYRCLKCGHEFEISISRDFISPHGSSEGSGWKYLKCPKCHERSRATVLRKMKRASGRMRVKII